MNEKAARLRKTVVERVLHGPGTTTGDARRAAFDAHPEGQPEVARELLAKVAAHAWKVTDEDVAAAKKELSDDQIFELCVAAALGQATRQLESAMAALDAATANKEGAA